MVRQRPSGRFSEAILLRDLERVRTRASINRLDLWVALSYLLGASVFLYLIVSLMGLLSGGSVFLALALLVVLALVGGLAAWFGQEAVVQFIGKGRRRRLDYRLPGADRDRLRTLEPFTRFQQK